MAYEPPRIVDYGELTDLTAATSLGGIEDGANKNQDPNHHSIF